MNILGFVFSLLLILSYSFAACWNKQLASTRLRHSYIDHHTAARDLINQSESSAYENLSRKKKPKTTDTVKEKEEKETEKKPKILPNGDCARINLWPLIQEGRLAHPQLYDLTCKLLDTFYGSLLPCNSKQFLDRFLASAQAVAQHPERLSLEKLHLANAEDQLVYYRMLKGTQQGKGLPSLLDYAKIDPDWTEKICLAHAHPHLLAVLFGPAVGEKLYALIQQESPPPITPQLLDQICSGLPTIASDRVGLYDLLLFGRPKHNKKKRIKLALRSEDPTSSVSLSANVFLPDKYK